MDYLFLTRKKKPLKCPFCGSTDVHPIFQPTQEEWLWKCKECKKCSLYGYMWDSAGSIIGRTLYKRKDLIWRE